LLVEFSPQMWIAAFAGGWPPGARRVDAKDPPYYPATVPPVRPTVDSSAAV